MNYQDEREFNQDLDLAKNTRDVNIQKRFLKSYSLGIRKALAKNPFLNSDIANNLLFDTSSNVSFQASKNNNCTKQRDFISEILDNKCVVCDLDLIPLNCDNCK
ncbi:hypothetical protein [Arcobacter sp. LA11]|uniref:hypothetical protein n=1 Tax=Arcobacter sp. LA11 TaxID=1898176 RepID=UPI000932A26A|nr:hypothetical protein [Arcobacter sp. LA11]